MSEYLDKETVLAIKARIDARRRQLAADDGVLPPDPDHGTWALAKTCRCDACRELSNAARRKYRQENRDKELAYQRAYKRERRAAKRAAAS